MTKKYDLSILIPSRNEMFLGKTIEDILAHKEGATEVIAVLDGAWPLDPIPDHEDVRLIHKSQSIGQRAATNLGAKLSNAKYLMKVDAHCAFDQGFDVKMLSDMKPNLTMVPLMKNLHAFDWVCTDGHRRYQGPSGPCLECGKETTRDIMWIGKDSPKSVSYCFDSTPHFQYFGEFTKRPEGQGDITPTMSLQGSCFMISRKKYWELEVCDEKFGSWGSQGIEVAVKTWLSGGEVYCNHKTWYAHMFRTQGGDFSFPYPINRSDQEKAKAYARNLFFNDNWDKQVRPLSWLVEKFWPVKGWTEQDLERLKANKFRFPSNPGKSTVGETEPQESLPRTERYRSEPAKGIIFYTDNQLKLKIAHKVQDQLRRISAEKHIPIVSASLKPMAHFGDKNVFVPMERGYLAYFTQILGALEASTADIIFFCEHDVLYHPSHFDFTPKKKDIFYYDQNWWRVRTSDGFAVHWDANQVSGLCCYRELALKFYRERLAEVQKEGYHAKPGFEPGGRNTNLTEAWKSEFPDVDYKHGANLSKNKWSLADFRDKSTAKNFMTIDEIGGVIPGWGPVSELIRGLQ